MCNALLVAQLVKTLYRATLVFTLLETFQTTVPVPTLFTTLVLQSAPLVLTNVQLVKMLQPVYNVRTLQPEILLILVFVKMAFMTQEYQFVLLVQLNV